MLNRVYLVRGVWAGSSQYKNGGEMVGEVLTDWSVVTGHWEKQKPLVMKGKWWMRLRTPVLNLDIFYS